MNIVHFNQALRFAAETLHSERLAPDVPVLLVRDVYGRLRFAVDCERSDYPPAAREWLECGSARLGRFAGTASPLFHDDLFLPASVFESPEILDMILPGRVMDDGQRESDIAIRILDRQIIGQDWLRPTPKSASVEQRPPRLIFYGLKGGVGRSTALAMLAYRAAQMGKRVLLLDFDLESPGLSGLLLPPERMANFGIVDWFVEDGVGQGDSVLDDLVSDSPLADELPGSIRIAAAMGHEETAYLDKLARVYADTPSPSGPERFAARMHRLVETLQMREKPDVVLIDSRAGLHDLAAISIVGLATTAYLFATDTAQSWQGYRQLFGHWQKHPTIARAVRERLCVVQALFPASDQLRRAERFLEHAHQLFTDTLYEEIASGAEPDADVFNFALNDESAPHQPVRIHWSEWMQEFDPLLLDQGIHRDQDIEAVFGQLFNHALSEIAGADEIFSYYFAKALQEKSQDKT